MATGPQTAAEWFDEGLRHLGLSRTADYHSEYRGDLEDAVAAFEQALALEPRHPEAQRERAGALVHLGRLEEAVDGLVAAAQLSPDDAALRLTVGQTLAKLQRHDAALQAFDEVLRLRSGDPQPGGLEEEAAFGRAVALTELRRDAQAVAAWDEVLGPPGSSRAGRVVAEGFRRTWARLARAACLARLEHASAPAAFREAFAEGAPTLDDSVPGLCDALSTLAVARTAYQQHLAATATAPPAWHRAGRLWLAAGRPHEALEAWNTVVRLTPGDAQAWFGKAEAHVQADELDEGIAAYRKALELWPEFLGAAARLRLAEAQQARR